MGSLPLQPPPAVHFIICPRWKIGPSKSPNTSSTRTAPATRRETTIPTHATLTSTSANPAATLTPEVSLDRYLSVVLVRRRQPRPLYARHLSAYLLFAGLQKDGDKDTPATMLRDVMRGMFVPPTTT